MTSLLRLMVKRRERGAPTPKWGRCETAGLTEPASVASASCAQTCPGAALPRTPWGFTHDLLAWRQLRRNVLRGEQGPGPAPVRAACGLSTALPLYNVLLLMT